MQRRSVLVTLGLVLAGVFRPGRRMAQKAGKFSGGHALIHPAFKEGKACFRPGFIAGHTFVFQAVVNLLGSRFDFLVRREVEPVAFHRLYVGTLAEGG